MQDAPKTEAQAAADAILLEHGFTTRDETLRNLRNLLALAYARGATVAATEAVKSA